MAAINPPEPPLPPNSADTEARRKLQAHVRSGIKPAPARTLPSNGTTARPIAGRKVGGGGRLRGGRG